MLEPDYHWAPLILGALQSFRVDVYMNINLEDGSQKTRHQIVFLLAKSANDAEYLVTKSYQQEIEAPNISAFTFKAHPQSIFQPVELPVEEAQWNPYVPGESVCPKCSFRGSKRILSASDGAVYIDDTLPDLCPNDSTQMTRVTWQMAADDAMRIARTWMDRARFLEEAWPSDYPMPLDVDEIDLIN